MSSSGTVLPAPVSAYSSVAQYRRLLTEGRAALREGYPANPSPAHLLRQHTALVDRVLRSVWSESPMPAELGLLAVGGYGRSQLFPHSDVDVLFLLPDEIDDNVREKVSELVGRLWDVGLEIGEGENQVRLQRLDGVEACMQEARDARLLPRLRRAHGVPGHADDAIALAEQVERLGRFFRQADDARGVAGHHKESGNWVIG
jgi:[protein-PII] uridylyltransferase